MAGDPVNFIDPNGKLLGPLIFVGVVGLVAKFVDDAFFDSAGTKALNEKVSKIDDPFTIQNELAEFQQNVSYPGASVGFGAVTVPGSALPTGAEILVEETVEYLVR